MRYVLDGSYRIAGKTVEFSKEVSVNKGKIKGEGIEGTLKCGELRFTTDNGDVSYRLNERVRVKDAVIYSGRYNIMGIQWEDAVALMKKYGSKK
jgi:hypothetical protein